MGTLYIEPILTATDKRSSIPSGNPLTTISARLSLLCKILFSTSSAVIFLVVEESMLCISLLQSTISDFISFKQEAISNLKLETVSANACLIDVCSPSTLLMKASILLLRSPISFCNTLSRPARGLLSQELQENDKNLLAFRATNVAYNNKLITYDSMVAVSTVR
ncbi:hypothetical protein FF38_09591 [Lucilia cuprina]|uniref:Uncharacterized protein n=1 Tax=Lucilia cuprina TaxID=7375 RepID=A0A0L0CRI9_LUCCU|nr:hypothetical protein FF38_09591 [Lucilia cuprina]